MKFSSTVTLFAALPLVSAAAEAAQSRASLRGLQRSPPAVPISDLTPPNLLASDDFDVDTFFAAADRENAEELGFMFLDFYKAIEENEDKYTEAVAKTDTDWAKFTMENKQKPLNKFWGDHEDAKKVYVKLTNILEENLTYSNSTFNNFNQGFDRLSRHSDVASRVEVENLRRLAFRILSQAPEFVKLGGVANNTIKTVDLEKYDQIYKMWETKIREPLGKMREVDGKFLTEHKNLLNTHAMNLVDKISDAEMKCNDAYKRTLEIDAIKPEVKRLLMDKRVHCYQHVELFSQTFDEQNRMWRRVAEMQEQESSLQGLQWQGRRVWRDAQRAAASNWTWQELAQYQWQEDRSKDQLFAAGNVLKGAQKLDRVNVLKAQRDFLVQKINEIRAEWGLGALESEKMLIPLISRTTTIETIETIQEGKFAAGKDCWKACGRKSGACNDMCGTNRICCRAPGSWISTTNEEELCPKNFDNEPDFYQKYHTCIFAKDFKA